MLNIQRILVPVDFSERSTVAAEHAGALARRFGADLLFVHVIPFATSEYAGFGAGFYPAVPERAAEDEIDFFQKQLSMTATAAAVEGEVQRVVVKGRPAEEIVELAKQHQVDLIVMPTHGYGPFRRFLLGSVTAKVLHDVECPVFTGAHVPEIQPTQPRPYQVVACAVDLKPHSEKTLRWAADFAAAYRASLVVIHATPTLEAAGGEHLGPSWRWKLIEHARPRIEDLLRRTGCDARVYIESADVAHYVSSVIADVQADLLVAGRSVRTGAFGRLRSNAYALIRESPCPVVSL